MASLGEIVRRHEDLYETHTAGWLLVHSQCCICFPATLTPSVVSIHHGLGKHGCLQQHHRRLPVRQAAAIACFVPSCNSVPESLSKCCDNDLAFFDTDSRTYATFTIDSQNEDRYIADQRCLLLADVTSFQYNNINAVTPKTCPSGATDVPVPVNSDFEVCGVQSNNESVAALQECCTNGTAADALVPYGNGCFVYCALDLADGPSLRDCIVERLGLDLGEGGDDTDFPGRLDCSGFAAGALRLLYSGLLAAALVAGALVA